MERIDLAEAAVEMLIFDGKAEGKSDMEILLDIFWFGHDLGHDCDQKGDRGNQSEPSVGMYL